jgi:thiol:disulfide interchange protein DsbD
MKYWIVGTLSFLLALSALAQPGNRTQVRLLIEQTTARPGDTVMVGIHLRMDPGWHTYWRNSGDSGAPTRVDWQLPPGVTAGEIRWPVPEKLTVEGFTTYVLHDEALLVVPLTIAATVPTGPLRLEAAVSWLECEKVCVPGARTVQATLNVSTERKHSEHVPIFERARARLPASHLDPTPIAGWEATPEPGLRQLLVQMPASGPVPIDFLPYGGKTFEVLADVASSTLPDGSHVIRKPVRNLEEEPWPAELAGLLLVRSAPGAPPTAHEVRWPLPEMAAGVASENTRFADGPVATPARRSLPWMLMFAFMGGLILNVMPCVLPVVALKVLGVVGQSGGTAQRSRQLGMTYGLGVICSFLVLAGVAIGVQQAGGAAGWGMAFRNPLFRVVMTVLVTLVALNLFGVFEVILGGRAMGVASDLASREGNAGAFFNGILATVLATPCTAPFLSVALAFAFTQSPAVIVMMFVSVGLGLAAPFVLLCWQPAWLKYLPKPGRWMERFKVAMGFPMLATAVWLFWSTAPRFGKVGVLWLGLFLVMLAASAWVWGEFVQRSRNRRPLAIGISLALFGLGYFYCLEAQLRWRQPSSPTTSEASLMEVAGGIPWQRWSPEAVRQARAQGRPVLVDFTADTCLNCQINKKTSIEIASTRNKLKEINALALLGDYTDEDPQIAAELKRFGRPGVPLVLVYPRNPAKSAIVLPEILTPGLVLEALNQAAAP